MTKFIYILFLILFSCGYPDIDSVPKFESTIVTEEELEDLCYLNNTDIKEIEECIKNINIEKWIWKKLKYV